MSKFKIEKISNRIYFKIKYNRNSKKFPDHFDFLISLYETNKDILYANPKTQFSRTFNWNNYNNKIDNDIKRTKNSNEKVDYDQKWFDDVLTLLEMNGYIQCFDKYFVLL